MSYLHVVARDYIILSKIFHSTLYSETVALSEETMQYPSVTLREVNTNGRLVVFPLISFPFHEDFLAKLDLEIHCLKMIIDPRRNMVNNLV